MRPLWVLPLLCWGAATGYAEPAVEPGVRLDTEAMVGVTRLLGLDGAEPACQWGPKYAEKWYVESLHARPTTKSDGQVVRFADMPLPLCFLTYDCERGASSTSKLLEALSRSDSRATGFWLGSFAAGAGELLRQWRAAGHATGLHSYGHAVQTGRGSSAFAADLERAREAVSRATGVEPEADYRFPYGEGNARLVAALSDQGFRSFFWSIDTNDWRGRSGAQVATSIETSSPGDIVLMHDTPGAIDAVARAVEALRTKGLEPVPISWGAMAYVAQSVFPIPGVVKPLGPTKERPRNGAMQVVPAPTGQWLAIVRDGALALWDTQGASGVRVATDVASVSWSPDGVLLAVTTLVPDAHVYLIDPGTAAAAGAATRPRCTTAIPGAIRVSTPGTRNYGAAFGTAGGVLTWVREGPGRPLERVQASVRRKAPWAVVSIYGAPHVRVSLPQGDAEAPCRLIVPLSGSEGTTVIRVNGTTRLHVELERGAVTDVNLAAFTEAP